LWRLQEPLHDLQSQPHEHGAPFLWQRHAANAAKTSTTTSTIADAAFIQVPSSRLVSNVSPLV